MVPFYFHFYADISNQYSTEEKKKIAISDHNIIDRKEKGFTLWLKMISHCQAQLQE
jgi:hypothetical protein